MTIEYRRFLFPLLPSSVFGTASAAPGWSDFGPITELNQHPLVGAGADFVFVETGITANPSGCSHGTGFYFATKNVFSPCY